MIETGGRSEEREDGERVRNGGKEVEREGGLWG